MKLLFRRSAGFTLIELLVVLTILGLMASLVGPQVVNYIGDSRTRTAALQIEDIGAALDLYLLDVGRYPSVEDGLTALVRKPQLVEHWNGPYLKKGYVPRDPWGFEYHYRAPGEHGRYDVYSLGADNREGGEGDAQDVLSWQALR